MRALSFRLVVTGSLLVTSLASVGCNADSAVPAPVAAPAPIPGPLGAVDKAYARIHDALIDDRVDGVAAAAKEIAESATQASTTAPAEAKAPLAALSAAATKLQDSAGAATPDIEAVRGAYGEVSRQLITIFTSDPTLQRGRSLFMCPMTKGYQQWIQLDAKLTNPYQGKKMLECGSPVTPWKA